MQPDEDRISTTALARKLGIPVQQLFATLRDYGWIERRGDNWVLTSKGEFEGGSIRRSQRYGAYIVWPGQLEYHPMISAIESNQRISAASMTRYYPRLDARQINRALAELGMQHHSILGWELTPMGRSLGGVQEESRSSGAFYVAWPHEIIDHPVVHRELTRLSGQFEPLSEDGPEPDLFDTGTASSGTDCEGIDGHRLRTPLQARVCNWLYLAQLAHAYERALPVEESLLADFYVPEGRVYIDCWEEDVPAREVAARLRKREIYHKLELRSLEINSGDTERLDEVLGRGLLRFGVRR